MSNINNATAATAKQPTKPKSKFRKFTEEEKQEWKAQKIAETEKIEAEILDDLNQFFIKGIEECLQNPELEEEDRSWVKILNPHGGQLPSKFTNGHRYSIKNSLYLLAATLKFGYTDHRWLSLKEAKRLNLEFAEDLEKSAVHSWIFRPIAKKGQKGGAKIVRLSNDEIQKTYKLEKKIAKEKGRDPLDFDDIPKTKTIYRPIAVQGFTAHEVYNICNFKGYEPSIDNGLPRVKAEFDETEAKRILLYSGVRIRFGYNSAYFFQQDLVRADSAQQGPTKRYSEEIRMPSINQFKHPESFYAVLNHELIHMTGSLARLNRKGTDFYKSFKTKIERYAFEELVAEIGAAMLCIKLGISNAPLRKSHFSYLASWLKALKSNSQYIKEAIQFANQAIWYIERTVDENERNGVESMLSGVTKEELINESLDNPDEDSDF